MRKFVLAILIATPLFANTTLFTKYEAVRQSLLKSDLAGTQKNAAALSTEAQKAKKRMVSEFAQGVEKSRDLTAARRNFAALSDEMIKVRKTATGARPSVYYCPMVKKSWLQPKGQIGNPYDSMMALCGELKAE